MVPPLAEDEEAVWRSVIMGEDEMLTGFCDGLAEAWVTIHIAGGPPGLSPTPVRKGEATHGVGPFLELLEPSGILTVLGGPPEVVLEGLMEFFGDGVGVEWETEFFAPFGEGL